MAHVSNPLGSDKASGKVGPRVYMSDRGINVVRQKVSPRQPRTGRQLSVRSIITSAMQGYADLSTDQVAGWNALASSKQRTDAVGNKYSLTSANAYMSLNFFVNDTGGDTIQDAPSVSPAASVASIATAAPASTGTGVKLTPTLRGTGSADDFLEVTLAGPFKSPNRNATASEFRHVSYSAGNAATVAVLGLIVDQYYWATMRYIDQFGQVTTEQKVQFAAITTP